MDVHTSWLTTAPTAHSPSPIAHNETKGQKESSIGRRCCDYTAGPPFLVRFALPSLHFHKPVPPTCSVWLANQVGKYLRDTSTSGIYSATTFPTSKCIQCTYLLVTCKCSLHVHTPSPIDTSQKGTKFQLARVQCVQSVSPVSPEFRVESLDTPYTHITYHIAPLLFFPLLPSCLASICYKPVLVLAIFPRLPWNIRGSIILHTENVSNKDRPSNCCFHYLRYPAFD
ncbi:hypothetical protein F5Y15DRAFT_325063 [Xylariaceae sp. FL0016]|nr:hypothetical protein F5Y15DRAFT_325063 [Xylariaceae sp. FL0016]